MTITRSFNRIPQRFPCHLDNHQRRIVEAVRRARFDPRHIAIAKTEGIRKEIGCCESLAAILAQLIVRPYFLRRRLIGRNRSREEPFDAHLPYLGGRIRTR
jgi:hypothetical protein